MTLEELEALIPTDSLDDAKAEKLIALGYPAVAPVLEEIIMQSLSDRPVANVFYGFVHSLGADELVEPISELLTSMMSSGDGDKSQILEMYVDDNEELARTLTEVLMYLADTNYLLFRNRTEASEDTNPTPHTVARTSSASLHAFELLVKYKLADYQWAMKVLKEKEREFEWKTEMLTSTKALLEEERQALLARLLEDTNDVEKAKELLALGYPTISPILHEILQQSLRENPAALVYRNLVQTIPVKHLYTLINDLLWFNEYDQAQKEKLISIYVEENQDLMRPLAMTFVHLAQYGTTPSLRIQALAVVAKHNLYDLEWIEERLLAEQKIFNVATEKLKEIESAVTSHSA